jgi:hypothetical protein
MTIGSFRDTSMEMLGASGGDDAFLRVLGEVAGGIPGAVAGLALKAIPAGPPERQGAVEGQAGLTYSYHPDERAVSLSRTDANGAQPVATLMRNQDGALLDHDGRTGGQIEPDGSVRHDPAWIAAHAMTMPLDGQASAKMQAVTDAETDQACKAPDDVAGQASEQAGNAGLPPQLRSNFQDARNAAFDNDTQLRNSGLQRFGATLLPNNQCAVWNAHHLMSNAEVRDNEDLFQAAAKAGWKPDEPENVIGLPRDQNAQKMLEAQGSNRPIHDNAHQVKYKPEVRRAIENVKRQLAKAPVSKGSADYNKLAKTLIEQEQDKLRSSVLSLGFGRLTEAEPNNAVKAA